MIDETYPDRLPAGLEFPDGHVLAFAPHRGCPCSDCAAAFDALKQGDLEVPEEGGLPC